MGRIRGEGEEGKRGSGVGKKEVKREEEREEMETLWNRGKGRQTLEGFLSSRTSES